MHVFFRHKYSWLWRPEVSVRPLPTVRGSWEVQQIYLGVGSEARETTTCPWHDPELLRLGNSNHSDSAVTLQAMDKIYYFGPIHILLFH